MIDKTISPLRQRMIEDMTIRHFKEKVQKDYIRHVKNFTVFLGRSPDTATTTAYDEEPSQCGERQLRDCRAAVLLQGDARTSRLGSASDLRAGAAQGADRVEPRGSGTPPRGRARRQIQGGTWRRLWRRLARVRGCRVEGVGYRQPAHDASGRTRQGAQGSICDAVAATARTPARLVANSTSPGLVVSWPKPDQPHDGPPAQSRLSRRSPDGGD